MVLRSITLILFYTKLVETVLKVKANVKQHKLTEQSTVCCILVLIICRSLGIFLIYQLINCFNVNWCCDNFPAGTSPCD